MPTRYKGFGKGLRELRRETKLSQVQFARKLKCDHSLISKLESDATMVSFPMLEKISKVVGKSAEEVVLFCMGFRYPSLQQEPVAGRLKALVESLAKERAGQ